MGFSEPDLKHAGEKGYAQEPMAIRDSGSFGLMGFDPGLMVYALSPEP